MAEGHTAPNWTAAKAAVALLRATFGADEDARDAIIEWCAAGLARAFCRLRLVEGSVQERQENLVVPREFWVDFRNPGARETILWATGDFAVSKGGGYSALPATHWRVFGVKFDEDELRANAGLPTRAEEEERRARTRDKLERAKRGENSFGLDPETLEAFGRMANPTSAVSAAPTPMARRLDHSQWLRPAYVEEETAPAQTSEVKAEKAAHPGGRPRKEFWEPLLIAAGMAIYAGWQPTKIAEVERWMAQWLSDNGHDAGEVAVRTRARALFNAYVTERDKN